MCYSDLLIHSVSHTLGYRHNCHPQKHKKNTNRSIELLQTDDLERFASLPLFEERYQKLTNVTFLELLRQMYSFGLTQVRVCECVEKM